MTIVNSRNLECLYLNGTTFASFRRPQSFAHVFTITRKIAGKDFAFLVRVCLMSWLQLNTVWAGVTSHNAFFNNTTYEESKTQRPFSKFF